jgi:aspartate-semialdehyde dehydrogenase
MEKIDVAVIGGADDTAFGWVAQQSAKEILDNHPFFRLVALIAHEKDQVGRPFAECANWHGPDDMPKKIEEMVLVAPKPEALDKVGNVKLIISALHPKFAIEIDPIFAQAGIPVLSESSAFRYEPDVPLLIPEVNADHLDILESQKKIRRWSGFIVSNPTCTIVIVAMSLKPILDCFGIKKCIQVSLQAMSGAGPKGLPAMAIIENVIPFIMNEEKKLECESPRILGKIQGDKILPSKFPISSSCNRIPVLNGHTICVFTETEKPVTPDDAKQAFSNFRGAAQELDLPSAPKHPIVVLDGEDRPQPRLDRHKGNGMSISIGRIRKDSAFRNGIKWIVCGDNLVRGTSGNVILNAELLFRQGLL